MSQLPVLSQQVLPAVSSNDFAATMQLGEVLSKSGYFSDAKSAAQAVVKILAGREMGFGPIASMSDVHIIEGKPSIGAHLRAAAIKRSERYDYRVIQLDRQRCELEFCERANGKPAVVLGRVSMTMQEAVESGLALSGKTDREGRPLLKSNWARSADDMLFARCISKGYRRYCPDLTGGVLAYDPDELSEVEPRRVEAVAEEPLAQTSQVPSAEPGPVPNALSPTPGQELGISELAKKVTPQELSIILHHRFGAPTIENIPPEQKDQLRLALLAGLAPTAQVDRLARLQQQLGVGAELVENRLWELYRVRSYGHLLTTEANEVEQKYREALAKRSTAPAPAA
jgi:hypothetical protein